MSFKDLKKYAKSKDTSALQEKLNSLTQKSFVDDSADYWSPTVDKAGNCFAILRFLPAPENEDLPVVKYYDHSFDRNGKWYIERSLSTFGNDVADPVMEYNRELWGDAPNPNRKLVSGDRDAKIAGSKRRLNYVANVLVIKDTGKPENEGKVLKYRFGMKVYEMIQLAIKPEFPDENGEFKSIDPFCFWNGADFHLKIRKNKAGERDYGATAFVTSTPLFGGDDAKLEALYKQEYSLADELNREKRYKKYEDLKKRLAYVIGGLKPKAANAEELLKQVANSDVVDSTPPPFDTDLDPSSPDFFERLANS